MPVHNHRAGSTNPVTSGVIQTGVVIAKGDIVLQNSSGYPYPAASETWDTDLATTQAAAKGKFLGIALEDGIATQRVLVATDGEFEFPITTGTPNVGGTGIVVADDPARPHPAQILKSVVRVIRERLIDGGFGQQFGPGDVLAERLCAQ